MGASVTTSTLVCSGLRKAFGDRLAVDGVSFEIGAGKVYGLLGPNGAGKTTCISMVCGLLDRDAGDVTVCGRSIDVGAEARRHIGYVPQEIALYPDLSGRENLVFWARMYGLGRAEATRRANGMLDTVGLADRAGDPVRDYSGGMQRRLNIAVGLLHDPDLLVLDEPTIGVDPQSRNAILTAVEELNRGGLAVLYTTHYMEEAERLCDRVGILDEGKMIAEGTRRELVTGIGEPDRISLGFATATGVERSRVVDVVTGIDGVRSVIPGESGPAEVLVDDAHAALPRLVEALTDADVPVTTVEVAEPDLEAVFLHLTGKALRD